MNNGFAIDANGQITIADAAQLDLNYDDGTPLVAVLTVEVSDGSLTDTVDVTVNLNPINDNTPNITDATVAIDESSPNGPLVYDANDANTGLDIDLDNDTLNYSIILGNELGGFAINASTGEITVADSGVLDFETNPSFVLTIETSDGLNTDTADITINLNNLNENTPIINDTTVAIDENSPNGTFVYDVNDATTGGDLDGDGTPIIYSIIDGDPNNGFSIDANTGEITIADVAQLNLDYDDGNSLVASLTVQASDGVNVDTAIVTVNLNPINDNAPSAGNDFAVNIDENSANGTVVGQVNATDADLPGDVLSYNIISGDLNNGFAIDANGQITIADAAQLDLNYDDGTPLVAVLTVEVSDGPLTDTVDVTVNLNPINDNAPNAGNDFAVNIDENSANGTVVGQVNATDADLPGDVLSYNIISGDLNNGFAIDANGQITIADAAQFDLNYDDGIPLVAVLTVEVSDGSLTDTVDITINLNPINDNAPSAGTISR